MNDYSLIYLKSGMAKTCRFFLLSPLLSWLVINNFPSKNQVFKVALRWYNAEPV